MEGVLEMANAILLLGLTSHLNRLYAYHFRWALCAGCAASDTKSVFMCRTKHEYKIVFLDIPHHFESFFVLELGKEEEKVFDPNSLDADRCESCYGAESEDIR